MAAGDTYEKQPIDITSETSCVCLYCLCFTNLYPPKEYSSGFLDEENIELEEKVLTALPVHIC